MEYLALYLWLIAALWFWCMGAVWWAALIWPVVAPWKVATGLMAEIDDRFIGDGR